MKLSVENKVTLITGSTRGIGKALARGFAEAGAKVWVHGREEGAGLALAKEIGGRFIAADLAHVEGPTVLARALAAEETQLDVLVNNAGFERASTVENIDLAMLHRTWQINLGSVVELTHLLLPLLKKSTAASIINVTSIHDLVPYPNYSAYSMSKAALAMFTKTACLEFAPMGIRINNLAPGAVETDMNRAEIAKVGADKFREWIPLGRVAQPEEMIGPALFLASDAARYVTGTTLYADGGYMQNLVRYRPEV